MPLDSSRPRLSEGPKRIGKHGPPVDKALWWWIHLSRIAIRLMLQGAQAKGVNMTVLNNWTHVDTNWTEALRQVALRHTSERIDGFPVPSRGRTHEAKWGPAELRELARDALKSVVTTDQAPYAHHPPEWRESVRLLKAQVGE